jgi:two-component system, cell cycle response regulator
VVYGVRVPRLGRRLWLAYPTAGIAGIVAYLLLPGHDAGSLARVVGYGAISVSAAVAIWYGATRHRPPARLPWLLLAAGQLAYAAADVAFFLVHQLSGEIGYPSALDLLYLGHYPLTMAAVVLLIRRRTAGRDLPGLLDAAVLAVAAGLFWWLLILCVQPHDDQSGLVRAVGLVFPAMDVVVLAAVLRLVLGRGRRPPAFGLFALGVLAAYAANTAYVFQLVRGGYQVGGLLDAVWLVGHLALGTAALHPSMTRLGEPAPAGRPVLGRVRFAALLTAVLFAPAALLYQWWRQDYADIPMTAVACAVLFGLTIARMAGLVAEQRRLAVTDGLTGLHTSWFADAQLALEMARARRTGSTLGFFLVDLDNFKSVNDRYGHAAGDGVLAELSARLRGAIRGGDVLARYGGDEFAVLAPGLGADELRQTAERLRERVAGSPVTGGDETYVAVTASVGAAGYPLPASGVDPLVSGLDASVRDSVRGSERDSVRDLVSTADRALSRAKATGRNRVAIGPASGERLSGADLAGVRPDLPGARPDLAGVRPDLAGVRPDLAGARPDLAGVRPDLAGAGLSAATCRDSAMVDFLRHVADQVDARLSPQEHSRAVGRWSRLLAVELGHDETTVTRAELAGRLHDVGKITLPEGLLVKPTPLTDEEWRLLRQHPVHGARLAGTVPEFGAVADVIRQHHERFDGAGYPDRLAGTAIRPEARILAVCDSWAAMRSDRAYQRSLSRDEARDQLRLGRGTQFDPDVVDLFLDLLDRGLVGELAPGLRSPAWWSVTPLPRSTVH